MGDVAIRLVNLSSPIEQSSDDGALRQNTELIAWSPCTQQHRQIKQFYVTVAVEVANA